MIFFKRVEKQINIEMYYDLIPDIIRNVKQMLKDVLPFN